MIGCKDLVVGSIIKLALIYKLFKFKGSQLGQQTTSFSALPLPVRGFIEPGQIWPLFNTPKKNSGSFITEPELHPWPTTASTFQTILCHPIWKIKAGVSRLWGPGTPKGKKAGRKRSRGRPGDQVPEFRSKKDKSLFFLLHTLAFVLLWPAVLPGGETQS